VLVALGLSGCGDSERNVILDTSPFYVQRLPAFSESDSDRVIQEVKNYAREKRMDFLLSRDGPDVGDFNATAAARDINLKALHVKATGGGLELLAYARQTPTAENRKQVREFVCRVAKDCGGRDS
jgi:hypothetical protein